MLVSKNEEIFTTWTSELDDQEASVVYMCGELDASSVPSFLADMQQVINRKRNVVMDVHLLEYVDSTGIAAILSAKNALEKEKKKLCLVGCHGLFTKILHAIHIEQELTCYEDVEEAIKNLADWQARKRK